jgi:hypothetical protein
MTRWLSTGYLSGAPVERVDETAGTIHGVKVCTAGEAKGHGVHLDADFVSAVVGFGNERKQGLKARFGHPNMCSTALGTFLGRFKNFREADLPREDGTLARTAVADLFLSNEARETPHGDLRAYVLGLAKNEPDMFGTSIVFDPGREFRKQQDGSNAYIAYQVGPDGQRLLNADGSAALAYVDKDGKPIDQKAAPLSEELYVECAALHACDCVDDPAANDGLFSRFSRETVAGQVTEFLDLHPEVWQVVSGNPEILDAIARHGDRLDEFLAKYRNHHQRKEQPMMNTPSAPDGEQASAPAVTEPQKQLDAAAVAPAEPPAAEPVGEPAVPEAPAPEPEPPAPEQPVGEPEPEALGTFSQEEFLRIVSDFGPEIAVQTVAKSGDYETARDAHFARLAAENVALKVQVAAFAGASPVPVVPAESAKPSRLQDMIRIR